MGTKCRRAHGVEGASSAPHECGESMATGDLRGRSLRRGAIKLMKRYCFKWVLPERLLKQAEPAAQKGIITYYERLMDGLSPDEKLVFADAVPPPSTSTGQCMNGSRRPTGWQRVSIHGTLYLVEMQLSRTVHLFLDNARCHHAQMLKPRLEHPECRLKLHFLPPFTPHLKPIKRLWGVMHWHVKHNSFHSDFWQFTGGD